MRPAAASNCASSVAAGAAPATRERRGPGGPLRVGTPAVSSLPAALAFRPLSPNPADLPRSDFGHSGRQRRRVRSTQVARGLITEAGHDAESGAVVFATTPYFLEHGLVSSMSRRSQLQHPPEVAELENELRQFATLGPSLWT